jgi:hypothetical protein
MTDAEQNNLLKYLTLIEQFINKQISALEFEQSFLSIHRNDDFYYSEKAGIVLSTLFSDIDSFCGDTEVANYNETDPFHDINESELRYRANIALKELKDLIV